MPLQNRVTPFGEIEAVAERGLLMGNRGGQLHDPATRTLKKRRWVSRQWIICVTEFRQRQRTVMSATSYTELFFLDEVTALAAGHRPCYECQRLRALQFAGAFATGQECKHVKAGDIDHCLHQERLVPDDNLLSEREIRDLPNGVMIARGTNSFAVMGDLLLPWSQKGYGEPVRPDNGGSFRQLTPRSTVAAMRAGYSPIFHPSAAS